MPHSVSRAPNGQRDCQRRPEEQMEARHRVQWYISSLGRSYDGSRGGRLASGLSPKPQVLRRSSQVRADHLAFSIVDCITEFSHFPL